MTRTFARRIIRIALLSASPATLLFAAATPAHAQQATRAFDIPAQPLSSAILEFSRQADVMVVLPPELAVGKRSAAIKGSLSVDVAIARLLTTSGLRALPNPAGGYRVGPFERKSVAEPEALPRSYEAANGDEILVTGTLIKGKSNPTNSLITIDRDMIEQSGVGSTQDMLQRLPQNFQGGGSEGASETGAFGQGTLRAVNTGQTGINLRGLNSRATLTLINGRRMAPAAQGLISADISLIPLTAVERIEVLADGASAIYGADAVAGVVNIILRKDFDGAETTMRYGTPTRGGTSEYRVSQSFGGSWGTGRAFISGEYYRRTALAEADRSELTTAAIGLADFLPDTKRVGLVGHLEQSLAPDLQFYADGIFGNTDLSYYEGRTSGYPNLLREPQNRSYSASAGLSYGFAPGWSADAAVSIGQSRQKSPRVGFTAAGAVSETAYNVAGERSRSANIVVNGELFQLPAGKVSIAFGGEYLRSHFHQDLYTTLYSNVLSSARDTRRNVYSAFGEMLVPIISRDMAVPAIETLTLSIAGRYDHYSDFGGTFNPKFGASWSPISGLTFRSSYSTSFRAPSSFERVRQNGGIPNLFVYSNFIEQGGTGTLKVLLTSGSKLLNPETSKNFSAGFAAKPVAIPGLTLDMNFFQIKYQNRIDSAPFSTNALNRPELLPFITYYASSADVDRLIAAYRAQGAALSLSGTTTTTGINYVYDVSTQNVASVNARGLDAALTYGFAVGAGRITLNGSASYMLNLKTRLAPTSPAFERVDTLGNPVDLRARGSIGWSQGGWTLSGAANYADGYVDMTGATPLPVSSYTTIDLSAAYKFGEAAGGIARGLTIRASILNLFAADPPYVNNVGNRAHFDPAYADVRGRFAAIEVTKRW